MLKIQSFPEKASRRIEECFSDNDYHTDPKSFYQQTFHKVFGFTSSSIRKCFEQADYKMYLSL